MSHQLHRTSKHRYHCTFKGLCSTRTCIPEQIVRLHPHCVNVFPNFLFKVNCPWMFVFACPVVLLVPLCICYDRETDLAWKGSLLKFWGQGPRENNVEPTSKGLNMTDYTVLRKSGFPKWTWPMAISQHLDSTFGHRQSSEHPQSGMCSDRELLQISLEIVS